MNVVAGETYWSCWVDSAGHKSRYDDTELTDPWQGRVVIEQRQGGLFICLARRVGENNDLRDAFYVVLPHPNSNSSLLFESFDECLAAWERVESSQALREIASGLERMQLLQQRKQELVDRHLSPPTAER